MITIEEKVLLKAQAGILLTPASTKEHDWMIDILKEAEGRAAEFDHHKRADKFRNTHRALIVKAKT